VSSAGIGARPGYPSVTVPWAFVPATGGQGPNAFPAGFEPKPSPFNVTFTGTACSEPKLIGLAYAFEQATKKRVAPPLFP
jgi:amidase